MSSVIAFFQTERIVQARMAQGSLELDLSRRVGLSFGCLPSTSLVSGVMGLLCHAPVMGYVMLRTEARVSRVPDEHETN